jgi:outer membrane protein TolC
MPDPIGIPLRIAFPIISGPKTNDGMPPIDDLARRGVNQPFPDSWATLRPVSVASRWSKRSSSRRRLNSPRASPRAQVEAAKQHRLSTKSLYFPNVSTQFENLHFNKALGELLSVRRPFAGDTISVPVNIIEQNQTAVNFAVVQPITPLFAVRQHVTIARADENIARAKAGMPVAVTASTVEKTYYDLLIAERELVSAVAEAKKVQAKWVTVAIPPP